METILALDPGKTTGYCLGVHTGDMLYLAPEEDQLSVRELLELLQAFCGIYGHNKYVVYEDFQYRNYARMGLDLTPVKMIGIIELCQDLYPDVRFDKQSASTGKTFFSNDELKRLGVYWGHGKGHGRDASRHLLQWMTFGPGSQFYVHQETEIALVEFEWLQKRFVLGGT